MIYTDVNMFEFLHTEPPEINKHVNNAIATKGSGTTIECKWVSLTILSPHDSKVSIYMFHVKAGKPSHGSS